MVAAYNSVPFTVFIPVSDIRMLGLNFT